MKKLLFLLTFISITLFVNAVPDEGMWIPILIEKYNIRLMQEKGFKLSAEDIYSVNKACMKDAVVSFRRGVHRRAYLCRWAFDNKSSLRIWSDTETFNTGT